MLNKVTIFLLLFSVWAISLFFSDFLNLWTLLAGCVIALTITFFVFRLAIITSNTAFLFLQFGFYKYLFDKVNSKLLLVFKICFQFLNPKTEFTSILDYVFLNKDSDAESVFTANLLTVLPGTLGILMKKRYLIVHSLDKDHFSLSEMYNITNEVGKIDDDSLV
jgi:multisubunit Na+/H+ antiporter MnhE subunit